MLDNTPNQSSKFKIKNWVEINDKSRQRYNKDNQVRSKSSMLRSNLCDYSDAYIFVKRTVIVENTAARAAAATNINKKEIFKNCAVFTNCISRIKTTQVVDAYDIDIIMPMYNLIKYSYNYSKISSISWQYCRDQPALGNNGGITDFNERNVTSLFDIKQKITDQTNNNGTKNVKKMVPLKYLSNLWRTLEMPLTNCETYLDPKWSQDCIIVATNVAAQTTTFSITDTKLDVPVESLSTQILNSNLLASLIDRE